MSQRTIWIIAIIIAVVAGAIVFSDGISVRESVVGKRGSVAVQEDYYFDEDVVSGVALSTREGIMPPVYYDGAVSNLEKRDVIQTGYLSLLVPRSEDAVERIRQIVGERNGFVQNVQLYEVSAGVKNGSATIRVPQERFVDTMSKIKDLATRVEEESINSDDVTEQLVDIEARLNNLRASEEQFLQIMKRAFAIEDVLNVQRELNSVRQQIESLEAQQKNITGSVEFSTINVSLISEPDAQVLGITWRPIVVIKQAARDLLQDLMSYLNGLIRFVVRLPIFILWVVTFFAILWILNKVGIKVKNRLYPEKFE